MYMFFLSIPILHLISLISTKTISKEELCNKYTWARRISLILGITYGLGIMVIPKLRRCALYSASIMIFTLNMIPFLLIIDCIGLILIQFYSLPSSFFISFITANYLPNYYRVSMFLFVIIGSLLVDAYSLWKGHRLEYRHFTFHSSKISKEFSFVHISDIHIGSRFLSHSQEIVNKIIPLHPNFVVITGDLTDSPNIQIEELMPFKSLTSQCPVYLSTGNHDYITGIEYLKPMLTTCGIILLENTLVIEEELQCSIIGTNDAQSEKKYINEMNKVSNEVNANTFNIILQHHPHGYQQTCEKGIYDLMLSGHTHVGQFAPFNILVYLFFKKAYGLYTIKSKDNKQQMYLYTHPGTGAWGPHMRSAGTNDITIFHIKP
ncbi:Ser/Thr phosphatase family protein [Entamoeba histolytica HM-3:IMSS]|uniref:Ser/Thr phosphatase family protein n=1 Tax=Entamoeba histolytica HM-3:IMSS TaxID=885315 RepID=M7WH51_ENTHI|nr:Ser/Thr phosphatase family protein [Entamoeba histolytica HM-3:IMSS]